MKNSIYKIIVIAALVSIVGLAIFINRIKKATAELNYGIAPGFKLSGVTFGSSKMILPFWINNPTGLNLTISSLSLDIFVNNIFAGKVYIDKVYELKKNSKSIVPLLITIDNVSAMNILMNVNQYLQQDNWRDKINISVRGSARLESGIVYLSNVPIKADGTYKTWMG